MRANFSRIIKRLNRLLTTIADRWDFSTLALLRLKLQLIGRTEVLLRYMCSQITPGMVIYDIGAHTGLYSLYIARKIACTLIYSFEPNPASYERLLRSIDLLGLCDRVIPMRIALDECSGRRAFFVSSEAARSSLHEFNAKYDHNTVIQSYLVDCHTIDELVRNGLCKAPDVIKIDTEGSEYQIILGAKGVLKSSSPRIGFEPHGLEDGNTNNAKLVVDFLNQFGYKTKSLGYPIWCYRT
jgi:FkbM family methyltransferase